MPLALTALPAVLDRLRSELSGEAADVFERIMRTNLDSVLQRWDDGTAFLITGDIPAMWLRDSATQLRPYLLLADDDVELQDVLVGVARRQSRFLLTDPYANSFTDGSPSRHATDHAAAGPVTWERKYELDSLCFPIELAHRLWRRTGRTDHLDEEFRAACHAVIDLMVTEQDHEARSTYTFERPDAAPSSTLVRNGRGRRTTPVGLVWTAFRPSDDACELGFNVPGNMFAVVALGYVAEIARGHFRDEGLATRAEALASEIDAALVATAWRSHPIAGTEVFAYEVDGAGRAIFMDDANMPSLLSAPLTGYLAVDDPRYRVTRRVVLSQLNPHFHVGELASGVGSPHTPRDYVWPIAIAVEGLTSDDDAVKRDKLAVLLSTTAGTGRMHESFDVDDDREFTREWFSWADAMFCELALDIVGIGFELPRAR